VKNKPMGTDSSDTEAKLAKVVAAAPRAGGLRKGLRWLLAALAPALVLGAWLSFRSGPEPGGRPTFQTEPVTRGSLRVAVSATGTLEPINQVDVGIEQSGTVATVFVDYNDRVAKGQVLARLDVTKLENQVAKAKASLASAEAKVLQAKATVKEARASLSRLREVARLSGGKVPAPTELETAEAELARAEADEADTPGGSRRGSCDAALQRDRPRQGVNLFPDRRRGAGALHRAGPDRRRLAGGAGPVHPGREPQPGGAPG
jgi:HlyD family secretion protein